MPEIIDLPEETVSDDAMVLAVYLASAGSQKSRRITRADFLDDVPRVAGDPTFGDVTTDNTIVQSTLTVGAVAISKILKGALAVTASTLTAGSTEDKTATLTGAVSGDIVLFSIVGLAAGLTVHAWVSSADTITFRITNVSGGSVTGASYTADTIAIRAT